VDTILRARQVFVATGLSRSNLYRKIKAGIFPTPVSIGDRAVGWHASSVEDWIKSRTTVEQPAFLNPQKRRAMARAAARDGGVE
jgi:prophage regulatory protein